MTSIEITTGSSDSRQFEMYEQAYGVRFVEPNASHIQHVVESWNWLADNTDSGSVPVEVPAAFLQSSLSAQQKQLINAHETHEVAAISVRMQDGLLAVPIEESFEPMASLPVLFAEQNLTAVFNETPFHAACGDWAGCPRQFWVRQSFGERLAHLGGLVSRIGLEIRFEDAFRPPGVQEGLFRRRVAWTREDHPDWSDDRIITEARSKTAVTPRLASHKGGAAVDITLSEKAGSALDIGHEYPEGGALVYQKTPFVTQEQWANRQVLLIASKLAGLAMYVGEDWHLSYGDNLASLDEELLPKTGYVASYGPIKDFDRQTGEITNVYRLEELDTVFEM